MDNVVSIRSNKKHFSGECRCLACKHEWVGVAEAGIIQLECPKCETMKGVFIGQHVPNQAFVCDCGCDLYFIAGDGMMCAGCGVIATGY